MRRLALTIPLLLVACKQADDVSDDTDSDTDSDVDSGFPDEPVGLTTITGTLVSVEDGSGFEGFEVCEERGEYAEEFGPGACVTTDADGRYSLEVLDEWPVVLTYRKDEFVPGVATVSTLGEEDDRYDLWPFKIVDVARLQEALELDEDDPRGSLVVSIARDQPGSTSGFGGVSIAVEPERGVGPVYLDPTVAPDPEATATQAPWGAAFVFAMDAGDVRLSFAGLPADGAGCAPRTAWGENPSDVRTFVRDGEFTFVQITCPEPG